MVNDSKTEFLIVGSKQQLERVNIPFIHVGEDQITPVTSVRNLGVMFDSNLKMDMQITKACPKRLLSFPQHQENPKIPEPGSHVNDYTCIYYRPDWLLQQFDEWTARKSHQETQACAKYSCQTSFQSEEIWSHNACTRYFTGFQSNTGLNSEHCWSSSKDFRTRHLPTSKKWSPYQKAKDIPYDPMKNVSWRFQSSSMILLASVHSQCMGLWHGIACKRKLGYVMKLKHWSET